MQTQPLPRSPMLLLRLALTFLLCLSPLLTLVHKDERGHWVANHSAYISPDEFAYLLTAENIAAGKGIVIGDLPSDAFYPPGFPAILAVWGKLFGFSIVGMHVCVALQQCVAVGLAYAVIREMPRRSARASASPAAQAWTALLLTALYATSWHVAENVLSIMADPAFTCVTLLWLWLALRCPHWWRSWRLVIVMFLLAELASTMRSTGIICVAATLLFPILDWVREHLAVVWGFRPRFLLNQGGAKSGGHDVSNAAVDAGRGRILAYYSKSSAPPRDSGKLLIAILLCLVLLFAYYGAMQWLSPEKGLFTASSENSYTRQLLRGLSDRYRIPYYNIVKLTQQAFVTAVPHWESWATVFCPLPREDAATWIPRIGIYTILGRVLLMLAVGGWLFDLVLGRSGRSRFAAIYILMYAGLYSIWPFDFVRFWIPILPVMIAYAWEAIAGLVRGQNARRGARVRWLGLTMCALLAVLNVQELGEQLFYYQNRIDHNSDCLAGAAAAIAKNGGDARYDLVESGEPFMFRYYTRLPQAVLPWPDDPPDLERSGALAVEKIIAEGAAQNGRPRCVYITGYFARPLFDVLAADLERDITGARANSGSRPATILARYEIRLLYQRDMVAVWVVQPRQQ